MRDNPDAEAKSLIECLPKRCPMCGQQVAHYFKHVDIDCRADANRK